MENSGKGKYKKHGKEWGTKENKNHQSMRARIKRSSHQQIKDQIKSEDQINERFDWEKDNE